MPIPRAVSLQLRDLLDSWLPALRDSPIVMATMLRLAFGRHAPKFKASRSDVRGGARRGTLDDALDVVVCTGTPSSTSRTSLGRTAQ